MARKRGPGGPPPGHHGGRGPHGHPGAHGEAAGFGPPPPFPPAPPFGPGGGPGPGWATGFGPGGPGGFGPGGFGPGGPGFRGFWRGPKVRRGDVRVAALILLAEEPRNGYQIIQEITNRSRGVWRPSPGSVYPALQQLTDEGLVRVEEGGGKRVFHLTDEGRAYVAEHSADMPSPWEAVADTVTDEVMEFGEAIQQVAFAAWQVARAGTSEQAAEALKVMVTARRALYQILAEGDTGQPPADDGAEA